MTEHCENCGADLAMVGIAHLCRPSSGDQKINGRGAKKASRRAPALSKKSGGGRPRLENRDKTLRATKPWVADGMSERTWFRRRAEKRAAEVTK